MSSMYHSGAVAAFEKLGMPAWLRHAPADLRALLQRQRRHARPGRDLISEAPEEMQKQLKRELKRLPRESQDYYRELIRGDALDLSTRRILAPPSGKGPIHLERALENAGYKARTHPSIGRSSTWADTQLVAGRPPFREPFPYRSKSQEEAFWKGLSSDQLQADLQATALRRRNDTLDDLILRAVDRTDPAGHKAFEELMEMRFR